MPGCSSVPGDVPDLPGLAQRCEEATSIAAKLGCSGAILQSLGSGGPARPMEIRREAGGLHQWLLRFASPRSYAPSRTGSDLGRRADPRAELGCKRSPDERTVPPLDSRER